MVCFINLDDNQFMIASVAIGLWNNGFNNTMGDEGLVYARFENATYIHDDCNVAVHYLPVVWAYDPLVKDIIKVNGVAGCYTANANERLCTMLVSTGEGFRDNRELLITTIHELGHIWGLEHVTPISNWEKMYFPDGYTIMAAYPQNIKEIGIHEELFNALHCRYGDDGWGGLNVPCGFWEVYADYS